MPTLTDIGRIGRDAELRYTANGDPVCNLAIACEYGRKDQSGKRPTQWVDATLWGKQAEALAEYLVKGQQIHFTIDDAHVEVFTKSDQTQGVKLAGRVIIIKFAGGPPQQSQGAQPQQRTQQRAQPQQQRQQQNQQAAPPDSFDDDIPFSPLHHMAGA
ncbi:MAG TPA: single-stranded DNA-binding protein [Pseudomonas sp.]|nr:single-stranded DNA-binding protein [Pseudomonas sp.]